MNLPPVTIAISCKISDWFLPNPGALITKELNIPLSLLSIKADIASCPISGEIITNRLPVLTQSSIILFRLANAFISLSVIKRYASSMIASPLSGLV